MHVLSRPHKCNTWASSLHGWCELLSFFLTFLESQFSRAAVIIPQVFPLQVKSCMVRASRSRGTAGYLGWRLNEVKRHLSSINVSIFPARRVKFLTCPKFLTFPMWKEDARDLRASFGSPLCRRCALFWLPRPTRGYRNRWGAMAERDAARFSVIDDPFLQERSSRMRRMELLPFKATSTGKKVSLSLHSLQLQVVLLVKSPTWSRAMSEVER